MKEEVIIAGFGGQGVLTIGKILTYAGMMEGKNVSWIPSYGPEMRGGTANCNVILSGKKVASPIVTKANAVLAMNMPSFKKFKDTLKENGVLLLNSSLISKEKIKDEIEDIDTFYIPANEIANELGNAKIANMVMLGAYIKLTKIVKIDSVVDALKKVLGEAKSKYIPMNKMALEQGAKCVDKIMSIVKNV